MTGAIVSGVLMGGLFALLALGFTVKLRIADLVNVAHGSFVVLGMYVVLSAVNRYAMPVYPSVLLSGVVVGALSYPVYLGMMEPARRSGHREQIVYTLLLLSALELLYQLQFGGQLQTLQAPRNPMSVLGVTVSRAQVIAGLTAMLLGILLYVVFRFTYVGKMTEMAGRYEDGARAIGIPVERVFAGVFVLGSFLAGVAGGLIMTFQPVSPFLGLEYVLIALIIAIAARLSFPGVLALGILYGVLLEVLRRWVGPDVAFILVFVGFLAIIGSEALVEFTGRLLSRRLGSRRLS